MQKKILGLDLGTNSIGWALLEADKDLKPRKVIDMGCRIFQRAVEDKIPTPKNKARRDARLARRVLQRRKRRKSRMLNFLISLDLLPEELAGHPQPEKILNELGDPYVLRAKALDEKLSSHELGRVFLHLVQRRGFQSNRKTLLGDMVDDPDAIRILQDAGEEFSKEESNEFKASIEELRGNIVESSCRTLGEYLSRLPEGRTRRNRAREGGNLKTDRLMYKNEFWAIVNKQKQYHPKLEDVQEALFEIIFFQRPLKLKADRVGKCSLEKDRPRAKRAWQLFQRYRYLQDINNLEYFEGHTGQWHRLTQSDREKLVDLFETQAQPTVTQIKKAIGLSPRGHELNLEVGAKKFKGNLTAIAIREVFPGWDILSRERQEKLEEDLITFSSKKALKNRLQNYWGLDKETAVQLCIVEFEPGHSDLSMKAIRKLLLFLEEGQIYSKARMSAGYDYDSDKMEPKPKLASPPEIPNPIVSKGLHELRRVVNALIQEYEKPDAIRLEMSRDLEMNTKRYQKFLNQQRKNEESNTKAQEEFQSIAKQNPHLGLSKYASHMDKLKYRLWEEQDRRCAYSGATISQTQLFTADVEIDHILPYSMTLNDSYMNKVICLSSENQLKGQRTPKEAYGGDQEEWEQIEQRINSWYSKNLATKRNAFYKTSGDLDKDFIGSQLTDTRYISREALHYLKTLGVDVSIVKGQVTSWLRHIWGLNGLLDDSKTEKDRTDHRHHSIDASVIASIDRALYQTVVRVAKELESRPGNFNIKDIHIDPYFDGFRDQIQKNLGTMIVSHAPQRKISGALHEDTGVGFVRGKDTEGAVYRKRLDGEFTARSIKNIVDPIVRKQVVAHLGVHKDNPKAAFAQSSQVLHKDGKTPIKRVRIFQSKTTLEDLAKDKLGIKNGQDRIFKWMTYGNMHHVEIYRHRQTEKIKPVFVRAMEAYQRVVWRKDPAISTYLDENHEFCFALHKNDMVSVNISTDYYRVQKIEDGRLTLRLHTASTLDNDDHKIRKSISVLVQEYEMKLVRVNAIGKLIEI
ncbi:MAG: type II CRISPR RNA-guided endonuclease Cas9 [Candidatus Poribacteria bacterium]|nr:type II CRISPR RNA-guided endonuclease Cas9 [Candidatus Poribacteria bacterium]